MIIDMLTNKVVLSLMEQTDIILYEEGLVFQGFS